MNTNTLPRIFLQRWAAACEQPSYRQWASIHTWFHDSADVLGQYTDTRHYAAPLRALALEAERNMLAMMPVGEAT